VLGEKRREKIMDSNTLTIIISILVPMLSGFLWIVSRSDKKFDKLEERLNRLEQKISRLEGRFEERGHWEAHDKKIGE
jgi:hypothetical protein